MLTKKKAKKRNRQESEITFKGKSKKNDVSPGFLDWLIYLEALGATSEKRVNLRLRSREDVDEKGQK